MSMQFQASSLSPEDSYGDEDSDKWWWQRGEGYIPDAIPFIGTRKEAGETASQAVEQLPDSWQDTGQRLLAQAGLPASPKEYLTIDKAHKKTPGTILEAYSQAVFWVSFAIRRALYDRKSTASLDLALSELKSGWSVASKDSTWICSTTGYQCTGKGSAGVLAFAIDAIAQSDLDPSDKSEILPVLRGSRRSVVIRQGLPVAAAVAVGAVVGTWWYRRSS